MPVQVTFTYDEILKKWDPIVTGASDELDAKQAFTAVILTAQMLDINLLLHTKTKQDGDSVHIIPAI